MGVATLRAITGRCFLIGVWLIVHRPACPRKPWSGCTIPRCKIVDLCVDFCYTDYQPR
jgi:hypothetical protein